MIGVPAPLLSLESRRNVFYLIGSTKLFDDARIAKQGYTSIYPQQTGVSVNQHIYTEPRSKIRTTSIQYWRRYWIRHLGI